MHLWPQLAIITLSSIAVERMDISNADVNVNVNATKAFMAQLDNKSLLEFNIFTSCKFCMFASFMIGI